MDPRIAQRDLRPPPQPGLPRGLLVAIVVVHVLVIAVLVGGVPWKRGAGDAIAPARPGQTASERFAVGAASSPREHDHTPRASRETSLAEARTGIACPSRPLLAAAGGRDGQLFPVGGGARNTDLDIHALLVAGKEAAAAGQPRDAEVAYLTACKVADAIKGTDSIESAEARYQLARHYLAVANDPMNAAPVGERAGILRQAQSFYADSLQRFRSRWGEPHEKTRNAAEGLEAARVALRQATPAAGEAVVTAPTGAGAASRPEPQELQSPTERPRRSTARIAPAAGNTGARNALAEASQRHSASPGPSFDCAKARSFAERTICSDAELAQLDRDLGRLYARARQAAADPDAFRRHSDAQWRRREKTCRDRDCLLRWYADRRQQLTDASSQAALQTDRSVAR